MSKVMANKMKNKFLFFIKGTITVFILLYILSSVSANEILHALSMLSLKAILIVLSLAIIQVYFLAIRWHLLAQASGSHISIAGATLGILMSFFFSQGLPAALGGDVFRVWWHRREGIPSSSALKIILYDRIYGLMSLIVFSLISSMMLVYFFGDHINISPLIALIVVVGFSLGMLIMPWRLGLSSHLSVLSTRMPHIVKVTIQWLTTTRDTLSKQSLLMTALLLNLGMLTHLLVVTQVFAIGVILSPEKVTLLKCLAVVPPALLISYMPFSIAGWGVREASLVVALGLLGVAPSVAILISIIIGLIILCVSLAGGLLWIMAGFKAAYTKDSVLGDKSLLDWRK